MYSRSKMGWPFSKVSSAVSVVDRPGTCHVTSHPDPWRANRVA